MSVPGSVIDLADAPVAGREHVGGKAAVLGELLAAGFPVPSGFVITAAALERACGEEVLAAARRYGNGPFAVRSSAAAEDLADASYAGLYETYLDIALSDLEGAVRSCFAAATSARVRGYASDRRRTAPASGTSSTPAMAVLVQQMVPADTAGVAFSAHPVTGVRDQVVVTAVKGVGEGLVSGVAVGEEWTAHADRIARTRTADSPVLDAAQARRVAQLIRRVAEHFGGTPQDIEWALAGNELLLLQARPMTAVPDPVHWDPPGPGLWSRNFRIGEWLPEAMTPLFSDWALPGIEDGYLTGMRATVGVEVPFRYATVNGWYYNAPPLPSAQLLATVVMRGRLKAVRVLANVLVQVGRDPVAADRAVLAQLYRQWRENDLPAYRQLVSAGWETVSEASPDRLIDLVGRVAAAAGQQLWSLAVVGGSAWKMEAGLLRFCRTHVPDVLQLELANTVQALLHSAATEEPFPPHAVTSLDWYWPTAGELPSPGPTNVADRHAVLTQQCEHGTAVCRSALASRPRLLARFDALLDVTRRYTAIREEQARELTLGWPLMRRCVSRLGEVLHARGDLVEPDDVFFLTRSEVDTPGPHAQVAATRRDSWEHQRHLAAPLTLGHPPRLIGDVIARTVHTARGGSVPPHAAVVGHPASAGRATGRVRLVTGPQDFAAFRDGEVLLAKATAPAFAPLFARAIAVVTDGGTLAAHASLLAREYGIPAVVATSDATSRLHTGQVVTVDGTAGTVHLSPTRAPTP